LDAVYADWEPPTGYTNDIVVVSPERHVYVNGGITTFDYALQSDVRLKKDIAPIEGALGKVMAMRGVGYAFKKGTALGEPRGKRPKEGTADKASRRGKRRLGFIAQEVEAVFPEMVSEDLHGVKSIEFTQLNAVLVEAIKDQQKIIDTQQARIERLEKALAKLGIEV